MMVITVYWNGCMVYSSYNLKFIMLLAMRVNNQQDLHVFIPHYFNTEVTSFGNRAKHFVLNVSLAK